MPEHTTWGPSSDRDAIETVKTIPEKEHAFEIHIRATGPYCQLHGLTLASPKLRDLEEQALSLQQRFIERGITPQTKIEVAFTTTGINCYIDGKPV